ncbi:MAG: COX15/CtaA family protein [Terracidiphilus sp.]|nr:COX15/CtaA family protein [Terracidiphilus sp.]
MTVSSLSCRTQQTPSPHLLRYSWAVLAYFIAVILWGTLVRATGAGAGCGNHWPLCNGTVLQHTASVNTLVEFTHRITSGLSLLAVLGLMLWTWTATERGHLARAASVAAVAFTVMEAILGALLVALGLTAQSLSPLRPWFLALHLTNTLLLLAVLALTAHLLSRKTGYCRKTVRLVAPWGALLGILVVMAVGVTGSLAALGDTLFPASSLAGALSQDFAQDLTSPAGWLVRWRWTHPVIAVIASAFLVWLLLRAVRGEGKKTHRGLSALVVALLASVYLLGLLDAALLAPVWAQVAHLLAADSLWVALVVLTAQLTLKPAGEQQ